MTDPDPFALVSGTDYDVASHAIRVRADRLGARVFTIEPRSGPAVRVLAHDRADAEAAADGWRGWDRDELLIP